MHGRRGRAPARTYTRRHGAHTRPNTGSVRTHRIRAHAVSKHNRLEVQLSHTKGGPPHHPLRHSTHLKQRRAGGREEVEGGGRAAGWRVSAARATARGEATGGERKRSRKEALARGSPDSWKLLLRKESRLLRCLRSPSWARSHLRLTRVGRRPDLRKVRPLREVGCRRSMPTVRS